MALVEYGSRENATLAKKGLPVVPLGGQQRLVVEWENESVAIHGAATTVVQLMGVAVASEVSCEAVGLGPVSLRVRGSACPRSPAPSGCTPVCLRIGRELACCHLPHPSRR